MEVSAVSSKFATSLLAMGRRPAEKPERDWTEYVKANYLDLDPLDQELVASYLMAYNTRQNDENKYKIAKEQVIVRIGGLYTRSLQAPAGTRSRITLIAKLINFQRLVRGSGLPVSKIKPAFEHQTSKHLEKLSSRTLSEIRKGPLEITPEELPTEIKNLFSKTEIRKGYSYWQYVKEHANFIIFAPKLNEIVKTTDEEYKGTVEELTKTLLIDTFWEKAGMDFKPWMLAATIIDETAHIEWYYEHSGNIFLLGDAPNERNSYITKYQFLSKLSKSSREFLDGEDRSLLFSLMNDVAVMIEKFNNELGYPKLDFEPHPTN